MPPKVLANWTVADLQTPSQAIAGQAHVPAGASICWTTARHGSRADCRGTGSHRPGRPSVSVGRTATHIGLNVVSLQMGLLKVLLAALLPCFW